MKLLVATVWAYPHRPLNESPLWQSCQRLGVPLFVSQLGMPFVSFYHNKVFCFLDDLRRQEWDIVLFIDADDAFLTRIPQEAIAALDVYAADFVVGSEVMCWPTPELHTLHYPHAASPCRFPNAGVWIAKREAWEIEFRALIQISESWDASMTPARTNDQFLFHERIVSGNSRMVVDDRGLLCLNLNAHPDSWLSLRHRILVGDGPPIIHGSGRAKDRALQLWQDFVRFSDLQAERAYEDGYRSLASPGSPDRDRAFEQAGPLIDLVRSLPPLERVVEIGSWRGVSTEVWALLAEQVYAVDLWTDADACHAFQRRMLRYRNVQAIRGVSTRAANVFPNGHFNLVYIAADHGDEALEADLQAWLPKVRPGGWIAGAGFRDDGSGGGVIRAVSKILGGPDHIFSDFSWMVQTPGPAGCGNSGVETDAAPDRTEVLG